MKVVADSHAIDWYLISPEQLSDVALDVLGEAEDTQGIAVSALTMPELWMAATRKRGPQALPRTGNPPLLSVHSERKGRGTNRPKAGGEKAPESSVTSVIAS